MTDDVPPALRPDHPLLGLGYTKPTRRRELTHLDGTQAREGEATIAEEVPVAFVYNMRTHAVMMATPADLEDFAVGFTITEGIVPGVADVTDIAVVKHAQGIEVQMSIPEPAAEVLKTRGRALIGRVGCGLCGVDSIQDVLRECPHLSAGEPIDVQALWKAEQELPKRQTWNHETGTMHAAAWCANDGTPRLVREDVGRHNALDKVIGAILREGHNPAEGFMTITSRASYELVQKCSAAGVRLLAAVSRPTGLAIALAEANGVTLVALLREHTANVYAHGERLRGLAGEEPRTT